MMRWKDDTTTASYVEDEDLVTCSTQQQTAEDDEDEEEKKQEAASADVSSVAAEEEDDGGDDDDDDGADHAEELPSVTWRPQNAQSTCEFAHVIKDYASKRESGCKKAEYSGTTVDEFGNRWRLIVYVNGNGRASNHHLSLFLQVADADDLPFGWKKAVSYVLTLEHPTGGNLSYAKRNPDKTFKLCPKAIDWGWSQFITSDRIQQEGFISDDSLTVRASVTVKSSSVSIDEEDSELYLKCAVEEGDAEAVKLCLEHGASVNCKFKDDLYTPLHTACSSGSNTGSMEVLNLLLEEGADVNACNKWKETPLLIAANNGHRLAVEALLKHGANPSLCSEAGWSALTFAGHKGYDDIVDLLLRAGAPVNCPVTEDSSTPLHKACAGSKPGHLASVRFLIDGGADVHALNKWRETPLLTAANHGQAGAVEALLAAGADPCKCTDTGWSPLSIAAYKGHDEVVRLLLEAGAPTEEDDPTLSALLQAATKGLPETVELLLSHGADHTVTTKKGDTALSILVEQNLIDAAVEMVTEYNASIARCSRDRKKVQRARLLINLRMKQLDRGGGKEPPVISDDDDDETDDDGECRARAAHDDLNGEDANGALQAASSNRTAKKKEKSGKMSAEEIARAAEEALLMELEEEETKAKKEEADANKKNLKKKKKKERERQLKIKEEQERREREEREANERERLRIEREEKEREERDRKLAEQREHEMKEMKEREIMLAAKRKEKEQRDRREQKDDRNKKVAIKEVAVAGTGTLKRLPKEKGGKNGKGKKSPTAFNAAKSPTNADNTAAVASSGGSRRWETAARDKGPAKGRSPLLPFEDKSSVVRSVSEPEMALGLTIPSTQLAPRPAHWNRDSPTAISNDTVTTVSSHSSHVSGSRNGLQSQFGGRVDHPAIALFRREKLSELIQRCTRTVAVLDELPVKRVFFRWALRASHDQALCTDPVIPSWTDLTELAIFFQRQFIAESRRSPNIAARTASMEMLKEAGSSVAQLCQTAAHEVLQFRHRIEEQLPPDWTDVALGMNYSEGPLHRPGGTVTLSWANRSHVVITSEAFASLQTRYVGPPLKFLAAVFVTRVLYETSRMIVSDTDMDAYLSKETLAHLCDELGVSAELFSDPFMVYRTNVFWGRFQEVDALFGGQKPFGKDPHGSEDVLAQHGGSLSLMLPLDPMLATRYTRRIVEVLDKATASGVPLSFAVFVHAECFHDLPHGPSAGDLHHLDPQLRGEKQSYIRRIDVLHAGKHYYSSGDEVRHLNPCPTSSLFVILQNDLGKAWVEASDVAVARVLASMSLNGPTSRIDDPIVPNIGFPRELEPREIPPTNIFERPPPVSPDPSRVVTTDFGVIGGADISSAFSPSAESSSRSTARRGRLFDLVDNGEEDPLNEVDIVSGMLNNLNVGLFQTGSIGSDVDIEAISLMGISGTLRHGSPFPGRFS